MSALTDRPAKPAPLRPENEESKAEWRAYLRDCAKADSVLLEEAGSLKDRLN